MDLPEPFKSAVGEPTYEEEDDPRKPFDPFELERRRSPKKKQPGGKAPEKPEKKGARIAARIFTWLIVAGMIAIVVIRFYYAGVFH